MSQQPVVVYPNMISGQQPESHSKESFGAVFIVLAVIVVISAIACFLGRICNRRFQSPKTKQNPKLGSKGKIAPPPVNKFFRSREGEIAPLPGNQFFRPKEGDIEFGNNNYPAKERKGENGNNKFPAKGDIEFGFEKRSRSGKGGENGGMGGFKVSENGEFAMAGEREPRFGEREPRFGA